MILICTVYAKDEIIIVIVIISSLPSAKIAQILLNELESPYSIDQ